MQRLKTNIAGHKKNKHIQEDVLCTCSHAARQVAFSSRTSINFQVTEGFISRAFQLRRHARLRRLGERLKHKLAGHTVDPDAFLHEGVLALITCC